MIRILLWICVWSRRKEYLQTIKDIGLVKHVIHTYRCVITLFTVPTSV